MTLNAAAVLPPLAAAAEIDTGNTAWLLVSTALVLIMAPGLAIFYGGMVRSRGVLNMIMMTFGAFAVVLVVWTLVGYGIAFGDDVLGVFGNPSGYIGLSGQIAEVTDGGQPVLLFAMFQSLFCVITAALVSGAIADRAHFGSWLVFVALWTVFVYAPMAHMTFGSGFLLDKLAVIDYAGGQAVEITSGASALALALVLGKRIGFGRDPMRPHNLTLVMLGAGLLWFGWIGFNAGSALAADGSAAAILTATILAGCTGIFGWLLVERFRDGHATSLGAASGLVAGLVAITPSCGSVTPLGSMIVGLAAGAVCAWAVGLKYRFGYDDSLDVVGVHGVGGVVGMLAIGLIGSAEAPTGVAGLFYGGGVDQLGRQAVGIVFAAVFAFVVSYVLAVLVQRTMGFRVADDDEISGIDLVIHAENAYDLHSTSGSRSPSGAAGAGGPVIPRGNLGQDG